MTNIQKDIFKIMQQQKDSFELYNEICSYIENIIYETKANENSKFYGLLSDLETLENNIGWDESIVHDKKIHLIWDNKNEIVDKYEDYL